MICKRSSILIITIFYRYARLLTFAIIGRWYFGWRALYGFLKNYLRLVAARWDDLIRIIVALRLVAYIYLNLAHGFNVKDIVRVKGNEKIFIRIPRHA